MQWRVLIAKARFEPARHHRRFVQHRCFLRTHHGDGNNGISTFTDTFQPGTYPANADEARRDCLAVNTADLSKQGYSNVGLPGCKRNHSTTLYYHVLGPNERSCMFPPGRIATTATAVTPWSARRRLRWFSSICHQLD